MLNVFNYSRLANYRLTTIPMDREQILLLLEQLEKSNGGVVLKVGDTSKAVVLTMESYLSLTSANFQTANTPEVALPDAPPLKEKGAVLVTGGAGYVGGHLVRVLLEAGYEVVVLDNLHTGRKEHIPGNVNFIEGDILDLNLLRDVLQNFKVTAVIHLAAMLEVEESVREPEKYLQVNAQGTLNVLRAMAEAGVNRLVFSSTAAVYGLQSEQPISETAVCNPTSPYGQSKLIAESLIRYYAENLGLTATVLRFFNVAGRNPDWPVADTHKRSHLIPIVLDVARGSQEILTVNGTDYDTTDGTCVRDYVHVLDIASAHLLALETLELKNKFEVFNVGTGRGSTVKEVVAAAAEVTGHMIPMQVGQRRAGDDAETVASVEKIKHQLGFIAKHSSLEEIIKSSW